MCIRNRVIDGPIFSAIGIDVNTLVRTKFLSGFLKKPIILYLVDDLYYHPQNMKISSFEAKYSKDIIKSAEKVILITNALKVNMEIVVGGEGFFTMPLTFKPRDIIKFDACGIKEKKSLTFLGNLNDLYLPGLKELLEIIELNGLDIDLKFTKRFTGELAYVNKKTYVKFFSVSDELMPHFISSSTAVFMPYAVDQEMTESSFPSKLLTYLAYAKNILFYTKGNNSVATFCIDNDIDNMVTSKNQLLEYLMELQYGVMKDRSASYSAILARNFTPESVVTKFRRITNI
jgi:hypothetical protein